MRRTLSIATLVFLTAGFSPAQQGPADQLARGIRLIDEGDFENGLLTLDTAVRDLAVDPAQYKKDLSQGYLYRGIAFVGLGQEESAKGSFAAALHYDKSLRLAEDRFPPRVVRVFEAARQGKTKSVLLPPSGAAKKAGMGAAGVGLIVGGVVVAGGAAAAIAGGVDGIVINNPSPTPAPPEVAFLDSAPPPGATISVSARQRLDLAIRFELGCCRAASGTLHSRLTRSDGRTCVRNDGFPFTFPPDVVTTVVLVTPYIYLSNASGCDLPLTTERIVMEIPETGFQGVTNVSYTFVAQPSPTPTPSPTPQP